MPVSSRSNLSAIARELRVQVNRAVKEGAEEVRDRAKLLVPYDVKRTVEEPHLRDRIHVERRAQGEYAVFGGDKEAWYGHLVEFGTQTGGQPGGRGERGPSAPHPFLIPAVEANRAKIIFLIDEALKEARDARG